MIPVLNVYDGSFAKPLLVGRARFALRRGALSTTFSYDGDYLTSHLNAYAISPDLPLSSSPLHCTGLPGTFRDSLPDRWGRHLIVRDHIAAETSMGKVPRQLDDVDFLTGVFDETREGSLRFRYSEGDFLSQAGPIPPLLELPSLLAASRSVAEDQAGMGQIKELLDAGSGSLGGARPKASIRDGNCLLLAKFSHPKDEWDVIAWEKTMLDIAQAAGIPVPKTRLVSFGREKVLLLERFDREGSLADGRRIAYMSAMSVLRANDGDVRDYAELAEEIPLLTKDTQAQLTELFLRTVFSVAMHNTDDHLRNWGFLRRENTWKHAPLFDVNPSPYANAARKTTIIGESEKREAEALTEFAAYAQLDQDAATEIVRTVLKATAKWAERARANGCPQNELELFRPVFAEKQKALRKAFDI